MSKIGRNDPCRCGSGKKFKHCHGAPHVHIPRQLPPELASEARKVFAERRAQELIREQQQGLGKSIVASKVDDRQFVAVRNVLHYSSAWRTFPDFLSYYIKLTLGEAWGDAEIGKPFESRHVILQWYDAYCAFQKRNPRDPQTGLAQGQITGAAACYIFLAYNLYLLDHNVELQRRLVDRLKDPRNFQGAYYELFVASILIRGGFDLVLEDETDRSEKHCEFAAVSKHTGRRFWVEAKMRAVTGLLGKDSRDGSKNPDPNSQLITHLNAAMRKPASDTRLIFVDLNADVPPIGSPLPGYFERTRLKLQKHERRLLALGGEAYVFVTSTSFHRAFEEPARMAAISYGIGIPDFNHMMVGLAQRYHLERRHVDAVAVSKSFMSYLELPATFDGSLPSEAFNSAGRPMIGSRIERTGPDGATVVGVLEAGDMDEDSQEMILFLRTDGGERAVVRSPATWQQLADYRKHRDAYFGKVQLAPRRTDEPEELFRLFMEAYKSTPRARMTAALARHRNADELAALPDDELLAEFCEALVATAIARESRTGDR